MNARNLDTQVSPPLHIAAPPQDAELERVKALLGDSINYQYIYRNGIQSARNPYQFQLETFLSKRRIKQEFAALGITDYEYIDDELDGEPYALVSFNAPPPTPEPIPVSHQIPAVVGIAEPGTLASQRGTPDYASHVAHLRVRALAYNIVARWMEAERFRQTHSKYNVWDHGALLGSPTHSAWVRLPDFQRTEAIKAKRLIDDTWWYAVDISTDPARTFLKWYREDALTLATPSDADKARDAERRWVRHIYNMIVDNIGQRVYIPNGFNAGAGPARGCDYTIVSVAPPSPRPDTATVRLPDGSTQERKIGVIVGEIQHWAREGKAA